MIDHGAPGAAPAPADRPASARRVRTVRPPRPAEHQQHLERLVESPTLRHQLGVNDVFVTLAGYARRHGWPQANEPDGSGLVTWWSEADVTRPYAPVRPDGYGQWAEHGQLVGFYLEYDTGTETQATVARKLGRYVDRYRTPHRDLRGVLLFSVATTRRETGIRAALARSLANLDCTLHVATTHRDYGHPDGPAGPVWAPPDPRPGRGAAGPASRPCAADVGHGRGHRHLSRSAGSIRRRSAGTELARRRTRGPDHPVQPRRRRRRGRPVVGLMLDRRPLDRRLVSGLSPGVVAP